MSVFSAASVLNSLAYLRFCSETVTHSRELHLALVMGFKRKCGVTSETGLGRRAGGESEGLVHKRNHDGRWMQIKLLSALMEEPKTSTQQNKYGSPRAQRDKSL